MNNLYWYPPEPPLALIVTLPLHEPSQDSLVVVKSKLNTGADGHAPDIAVHVFNVPSSIHPPVGSKVSEGFFKVLPTLPNTNQLVNVVAVTQEIVNAELEDDVPVYDGLPLTKS